MSAKECKSKPKSVLAPSERHPKGRGRGDTKTVMFYHCDVSSASRVRSCGKHYHKRSKGEKRAIDGAERRIAEKKKMLNRDQVVLCENASCLLDDPSIPHYHPCGVGGSKKRDVTDDGLEYIVTCPPCKLQVSMPAEVQDLITAPVGNYTEEVCARTTEHVRDAECDKNDFIESPNMPVETSDCTQRHDEIAGNEVLELVQSEETDRVDKADVPCVDARDDADQIKIEGHNGTVAWDGVEDDGSSDDELYEREYNHWLERLAVRSVSSRGSVTSESEASDLAEEEQASVEGSAASVSTGGDHGILIVGERNTVVDGRPTREPVQHLEVLVMRRIYIAVNLKKGRETLVAWITEKIRDWVHGSKESQLRGADDKNIEVNVRHRHKSTWLMRFFGFSEPVTDRQRKFNPFEGRYNADYEDECFRGLFQHLSMTLSWRSASTLGGEFVTTTLAHAMTTIQNYNPGYFHEENMSRTRNTIMAFINYAIDHDTVMKCAFPQGVSNTTLNADGGILASSGSRRLMQNF